jgi:dsRNA-specific ribonuclease
MGPTFPARILNNTVMLNYEAGISFVFHFQDKFQNEALTHDNLHLKENDIVKINICNQDLEFGGDI